jgi:hypothetical protein
LESSATNAVAELAAHKQAKLEAHAAPEVAD